jgi:hypothetical protein
MIWALGQDATPAGQVLLRSVGVAMQSPTPVNLDANEAVPDRIILFPCSPNPWNPSTIIRFALPEAGHLIVTVHDLLGRTLATLVDGYRPRGQGEIRLEADRGWSSGIYFIRLDAGGHVQTTRTMLLR